MATLYAVELFQQFLLYDLTYIAMWSQICQDVPGTSMLYINRAPVSYLYAHSSLPRHVCVYGVGAFRGRVKIRTIAGLPVRIGDFEA